jgi:hypothetical protein
LRRPRRPVSRALGSRSRSKPLHEPVCPATRTGLRFSQMGPYLLARASRRISPTPPPAAASFLGRQRAVSVALELAGELGLAALKASN